MTYAYCKYHEEHLETDGLEECFSGECDISSCRFHPDHGHDGDSDKLKQFRSSEFANATLKKLSAMFELSEEDAAAKLGRVFSDMQAEMERTIKMLVRQAVSTHITHQFDAVVRKHVQEVFQTAIDANVLQIDPDGKVAEKSIKKYVLQKVTKLIDAENKAKQQGRHNQQSESVEKAIENLVGNKVEEASAELLAEVRENFSKAAMKKMMEGMVKALGDDKRLLAVMTQS